MERIGRELSASPSIHNPVSIVDLTVIVAVVELFRSHGHGLTHGRLMNKRAFHLCEFTPVSFQCADNQATNWKHPNKIALPTPFMT